MTLGTTERRPAVAAGTPDLLPEDVLPDIALVDGWQALAVASLGRLLTRTELAALAHLPVGIGLDLLFPDLGDAARHEALCMLDDE
jgi:hypothetical protein